MSRDAMRCHGDELYYSRTILVLQNANTNTTLYYKVLLKYYSSTNLHYKVLLQY